MSRLRLRTFPSNVTDVNREKGKNKMRKKEVEKYWENEDGETIEFGKHFMRCFDKAGKLQFGKKFYDPANGELKYKVNFVLDREELVNSKEGAEYLMQTIEDWKNQEGDING